VPKKPLLEPKNLEPRVQVPKKPNLEEPKGPQINQEQDEYYVNPKKHKF
jgi:hypothetical protein